MSSNNNTKKNNANIIELTNVTRSFGYNETESFALKDFNLKVKTGEFIMIMGPSGCGKTTLLNILGLLDFPTSGSYFLDSESTTKFTRIHSAHIRAKKIGFIFQDFNLIPKITILENVSLPLVYSGLKKTKCLLRSSEMLSTFNMQEKEYFFPYQLSGGQKQRVAIARALVSSPEIILADEPTGNLDSRNAHIVMEELRRIHSEGNTIIMVTHNPSLTTYATRVIHMLDGQIATDVKTVADEDLPERIEVRFSSKPTEEQKIKKSSSISSMPKSTSSPTSPSLVSSSSTSLSTTPLSTASSSSNTSTTSSTSSLNTSSQETTPPLATSSSISATALTTSVSSKINTSSSSKNPTPSASASLVSSSHNKSSTPHKVFPVVSSTLADTSVRITKKPSIYDILEEENLVSSKNNKSSTSTQKNKKQTISKSVAKHSLKNNLKSSTKPLRQAKISPLNHLSRKSLSKNHTIKSPKIQKSLKGRHK